MSGNGLGDRAHHDAIEALSTMRSQHDEPSRQLFRHLDDDARRITARFVSDDRDAVELFFGLRQARSQPREQLDAAAFSSRLIVRAEVADVQEVEVAGTIPLRNRNGLFDHERRDLRIIDADEDVWAGFV
jgi:hypothetical protein